MRVQHVKSITQLETECLNCWDFYFVYMFRSFTGHCITHSLLFVWFRLVLDQKFIHIENIQLLLVDK